MQDSYSKKINYDFATDSWGKKLSVGDIRYVSGQTVSDLTVFFLISEIWSKQTVTFVTYTYVDVLEQTFTTDILNLSESVLFCSAGLK